VTFLPSLPDSAKLLDVFRVYPDTAHPLVDYHEALMRASNDQNLWMALGRVNAKERTFPRMI